MFIFFTWWGSFEPSEKTVVQPAWTTSFDSTSELSLANSSVGLSSVYCFKVICFSQMRSSNLSICLNYSHWIFQGFLLFSYQGSLSFFNSNFDSLSYLLLFVNNFFIFVFRHRFVSLRQLFEFITISFDCQELFYFYFSQPFQSQATFIVYHSCFYVSRTFFAIFSLSSFNSLVASHISLCCQKVFNFLFWNSPNQCGSQNSFDSLSHSTIFVNNFFIPSGFAVRWGMCTLQSLCPAILLSTACPLTKHDSHALQFNVACESALL